MWIVSQRGGIVNRRDRQPTGRHLLDQIASRGSSCPCGHGAIDLAIVDLVCTRSMTDELEQLVQVTGCAAADRHPCVVLAAVRVADRRAGQPSALTRRWRLARHPLGDGRCGDVQECVERVDIDDPSAPAVRSFVAGRQHAERADPPRHRVAERHRRKDRFAVGVPREVGETRECLTERPGAREVSVRTVETETCDAHEDEAGVDLGESIPRQPAPLHLVREQVHDEDVDVRHEPAQEVASCLRCQIDRHRTLVASQDRPHRPSSIRVPARRLHLDHVGAVVGEQRRDERSGIERRSIDDAQAVERAAGVARGAVPAHARSGRAASNAPCGEREHHQSNAPHPEAARDTRW